MATTRSQRRWRGKHRLVKSQLNVMARKHTHDTLDSLADRFALRGKGEAVTFACFLARALLQRAEHSAEAAQIVFDAAASYHRDRELHSA